MKKILLFFMLAVSSLTFGQVKDLGGEITYGKADTLTEDYQSLHSSMPFAFTVGRDILDEILNQEGVLAIRFYPGLDEESEVYTLVYIGVDEDGDNTGMVADLTPGLYCPPNCNVQKPRPPMGGGGN